MLAIKIDHRRGLLVVHVEAVAHRFRAVVGTALGLGAAGQALDDLLVVDGELHGGIELLPEAGEQFAQRRGLRWNENGRWGLNFNLNQPVGREADWGDVEAGAYYRLSPRLRVGAAANLASPELDPARAPDGDRRAAPRVRLETIFKF